MGRRFCGDRGSRARFGAVRGSQRGSSVRQVASRVDTDVRGNLKTDDAVHLGGAEARLREPLEPRVASEARLGCLDTEHRRSSSGRQRGQQGDELRGQVELVDALDVAQGNAPPLRLEAQWSVNDREGVFAAEVPRKRRLCQTHRLLDMVKRTIHLRERSALRLIAEVWPDMHRSGEPLAGPQNGRAKDSDLVERGRRVLRPPPPRRRSCRSHRR